MRKARSSFKHPHLSHCNQMTNKAYQNEPTVVLFSRLRENSNFQILIQPHCQMQIINFLLLA